MLETVRLQLHDHALGLGFIVPAGSHVDRIAVAEFGPQGLVEQLLVMRDDVVCRFQYPYGRPVVLLKLDHLERGKFIGQFFQVVDIGPAPAVDRLVIIADGSELGPDTGQQLEQQVLAGVGVLIFIDQQVTQSVLPLFGNLRMLAEQFDRQADQVVEIDRLIGLERRLIAQVSAGGECFMLVNGELAGGFGRDQGILPVGDDGLQTAQCCLVDGFGTVADDAGTVGGIENGKARLVAQRLGFLAQDAHAQ